MHTSLPTAATTALLLISAASPAWAQAPCDDGCSPNYWKNHKEDWDGLNGDDQTQNVQLFMSFNAVFGVTPAQSGIPNSRDLGQVVATQGSGLTALNRHAVAALANADSVCSGVTVGQVIDLYRDAVDAIPGPETVGSATTILVGWNSGACPLQFDPPPPPPRIFCVADQGDCPSGAGSLLAGCANSSGLGARLDVLGSSSVAADDLELVATQLPTSTFVLFLMADAPRRAPWQDGLLCVGGPMSKIYRIPPILMSGPTGTAHFPGGLVALSNTTLLPVPGGIQAGDTFYFQTYFRDVPGGPNGANTSNTVAVTFAP